MDIKLLLGEYFCERYSIDGSARYDIEWIDAKGLLVPGRFDLMAKLVYAESYLSQRGMEWATELYRKHIEAFSGGRESGNKEKRSVDDYVRSFNRLIDDLKRDGFSSSVSVIPVGRDDEIMDGAHRVSAAAALGSKVPIIRFPQLIAGNDHVFFQKAMLSQNYLDHMAYKYITMHDDVHCACIWPIASKVERSSEKQRVMEHRMEQEGRIVYKKRLYLNYNGIRNFMIQVYSGFEWMGEIDSHFKGAKGYADQCYRTDTPMYLYVLQIDTIQHTLDLKSEIRKLFGIGNLSIHISDEQKEAVQIGQMLLNDNSVHYLNYGKPDKDITYFKKVLGFSSEIQRKDRSLIEEILLVNDSVLAMYGLKNGHDVLYTGKDIRNDMARYVHDKVSSKWIYHPEHYFYYGGIKFLCLQEIYRSPGSSKDDRDRIKTVFDLTSIRKKQKNALRQEMRRKCRVFKIRVRNWLVEKDMIDIPMKIYHFMVRKYE